MWSKKYNSLSNNNNNFNTTLLKEAQTNLPTHEPYIREQHTYIVYMFQTKSVFGPYAYGPDQIRILIWSDHTRMVMNELDQIGI